jgi:hypothetical protein
MIDRPRVVEVLALVEYHHVVFKSESCDSPQFGQR